jgi:hypothetical protein
MSCLIFGQQSHCSGAIVQPKNATAFRPLSFRTGLKRHGGYRTSDGKFVCFSLTRNIVNFRNV